MTCTKKLASILLALAMVLSLVTTAGATQEGEIGGGSITIDNAVDGETYSIYQILYLESYDSAAGAYAYKANSAWENWLGTQTDYVSIDGQGYVTWVGTQDAARVAAFAAAAKKHAEETPLPADKTGNTTSTTVTFTGLNLGYYLVTTSLGTLCSLDTTNPEVKIEEKNTAPTIDKEVQEDSTNAWGEKNDADIGQTVNFRTTVHAKKGAQNYKVHDKMSEGLTFGSVTSVKVGDSTLTKDTDYTVVTTDICTDCDFHVVFTQTYLDTITADTNIVIEYTATLNENAVIYNEANTNDTKLSYGEHSETEWDQTSTYAYKFDIIKTDSSMKVLNGAKFELYTAATDGNKINLVKETDGTYRVATATEAASEGFTFAVIEAGTATIKGLDGNTTYYLEETEAPAGYNKLSGRIAVKIESANLTTTMSGDTWAEGDGGVQITNNTGTELPSTGGMGTTVLYVAGGALVLLAMIVLVMKKRMGNAK